MFKYKYVRTEPAGKLYWIDRATLINSDGPNSEDCEWYQIDLTPKNKEDDPIVGLDLLDFGDEVHISKYLVPRLGTKTTIACVNGETLIVWVEDRKLDGTNLAINDSRISPKMRSYILRKNFTVVYEDEKLIVIGEEGGEQFELSYNLFCAIAEAHYSDELSE